MNYGRSSFREAAAIVGYVRELGVSHLYLSPCFEAAASSTHGYDVVDPNRLRGELGGSDGSPNSSRRRTPRDLAIVVDIVPHHMAASAQNAWWWSVLELGRESPYAFHFDIDWIRLTTPPRHHPSSVLATITKGARSRRVAPHPHCARGVGRPLFDNIAPLSRTRPMSVGTAGARLRRRGRVEEVNKDIDRLDALLERQHHRLARWQAAAHELDYRRFFDIDSLVALEPNAGRLRRPHRLTSDLSEGKVDGLRVDHVDGLRDPEATSRA